MNIKNIVLILTDQQRWDAMGCAGNGIVRTPNIDRLAARGVRFANTFSPCPVCTPARASLFTGMLTHKHGLYFNSGYAKRFGGAIDLTPDMRIFSQDLAERDWHLAYHGKWHIGENNPISDYGFAGVDYPEYGYPDKHPHYLEWLKQCGVDGFKERDSVTSPDGVRRFHGLQEGPPEASIPNYLAEQTVESIARFADDGRPFFITCGFWGPHAPFVIPEPYYSMYDGADIAPWPNFDCGTADKPGVLEQYARYWHTDWITRENLPGLIGKYYGYMTCIDDAVGRIVGALETARELDRTLVLFTSDHGSSVGAYRIWDKGFGMYDCITRVPFIASHPDLAPRETEAFASLLDIAPTVLDLAGCDPCAQHDGRSLSPVLRGEADAVRGDFIVTEHFGHQAPFWQRMVRTRTAKYIHNPTSRDEFYDLAADPWETRNILDAADPAELRAMRDRLLDWMQETRDPSLGWSRHALCM